MIRLLTLLLSVSIGLPAADYMPLDPGNTWTYRSVQLRDTFTITVANQPAVIDGQVYYRLTGYVREPLWVRSAEDGLYYRDEENDRDVLLTGFVPSAPFPAPVRECEDQGEAALSREPYEGPVGRFASPLEIRYTTHCADAGTTSELYAANVGMVRRTVTTIAGPRTYELVDAHLASVSASEKPNTAFRVSVQRIDPSHLVATLTLANSTWEPIRLRFSSSQEYDLRIVNAKGEVLFVWSADKAFLQVVKEVVVGRQRSYTVDLPLPERLAPGSYTLEAWITSGESRREFSAITPFTIPEDIQPARTRREAPGKEL